MNGPITLGGGVMAGIVTAGAHLSRWWVRPARTVEEPAPRPRGRHRAPAPVPGPLVAPEAGPEPVESLVIRVVRCPACRADTRHVRFAVLKGLMCLDCGPWEA